MSVSTNLPFNGRLINDGFYVASGSLTTTLGSFNFSNTTPYPTTEKFDVKVNVSGSGTGVAVVSVYLQDSPDNSTFTNVVGLAAPLFTAVPTASVTLLVKLPPSSSQYLRASASVNSSNYTGSVYGASVQF